MVEWFLESTNSFILYTHMSKQTVAKAPAQVSLLGFQREIRAAKTCFLPLVRNQVKHSRNMLIERIVQAADSGVRFKHLNLTEEVKDKLAPAERKKLKLFLSD